jgi:hypothetical protein
MNRQVGEVGDGHALLAELGAELRHFLVRQLQEFVEQAKLVHHVQRRGMDGVTAEVAQEVAVLLQHDAFHPGARQQEAQHHAGRAATHDAALGGDRRHSSISRKTRPVALMASSAGTPSGPLTHSLVTSV